MRYNNNDPWNNPGHPYGWNRQYSHYHHNDESWRNPSDNYGYEWGEQFPPYQQPYAGPHYNTLQADRREYMQAPGNYKPMNMPQPRRRFVRRDEVWQPPIREENWHTPYNESYDRLREYQGTEADYQNRNPMQGYEEPYDFEDERLMGSYGGDWGGRGHYSPGENFSYTTYRFGRARVPYQENRYQAGPDVDSRYRSGWGGDTGYTSQPGGYNAGWDDDSWNSLEDGESMGW